MPEKNKSIAIIGGGAAGFFAAITCAQQNPGLSVYLFEKTSKLLAKVKVSGGGRCNVTHHCFNPHQLIQYYPRGGKFLKTGFKKFGAEDTVNWFRERGVILKTEGDGRMFPVTDDSATIVNCLLNEAQKAGVKINTNTAVEEIIPVENGLAGFRLRLSGGQELAVNKVLVSTGGNPKPESYAWLKKLGHTILDPVPSLFTFNVPDSPLKELQGISVGQAKVKIAGHHLENEGPFLFTHWGFSGPAVLKLSAWSARTLHQLNYQFQVLINLAPAYSEDALRLQLADYRKQYPKRIVSGHPLFNLPQRLWKALTELAAIPEKVIWAELPAKNQNKLVEQLLRAPFQVKGKTTFKEEFVTCGGVDLNEIKPETMESKVLPNLYFAGEVMDIDGVTGGFNFQAAWTTGYLAGQAMAG
ncbi:carbon dioxide concentrating mechanism protein CcmK [Adhaeribacter aerolatus]|uniref:Carbon dioxide concentrating mechanism protein CcmK n=1 Tax=Adhaeribacter aerolatus TaxID=670289 RepID=A0A512B4P6_9BACT|nr:NAD(P)/FAD-dependent oxidoreductase [Adhaeribacter aerolatus]GEO06929.1 carbon dioxide concentrating mechanism protein CcmK [Adhaeribacter aerolatus]